LRSGVKIFTTGSKSMAPPSGRGRRVGRGRALTTNPLAQADVYRIIRRHAFSAGIKTRIGNHTFRATGITQYLRNGGRRELAQQMAAHESPRTTALYDRRGDEVAVDEVERILI
jgi:integrase/recombinase XerD